MASGGRPTSFREEYVRQAKVLYERGLTDVEVAEFFGVCVKTLFNWQEKHHEFLQAKKEAKAAWDDRIERSLAERAMGYSCPETKVFCYEGQTIEHEVTKHYPPDTAAAFIWLKNRRPEQWRDKKEVEHSGALSLQQLVSESWQDENDAGD